MRRKLNQRDHQIGYGSTVLTRHSHATHVLHDDFDVVRLHLEFVGYRIRRRVPKDLTDPGSLTASDRLPLTGSPLVRPRALHPRAAATSRAERRA